MTAEEFKRQFAKTRDKRTKKKTASSRAVTNTGQKVKLVRIVVDDVEHLIPENQIEIIQFYNTKSKK